MGGCRPVLSAINLQHWCWMQSPRFRLVVWYTSAAGQSSYDDDDDDDDEE